MVAEPQTQHMIVPSKVVGKVLKERCKKVGTIKILLMPRTIINTHI